MIIVVSEVHCTGYSVSNQTLTALVQRYSNKKGRIQFDDFILLVAKLTTMFGTWWCMVVVMMDGGG